MALAAGYDASGLNSGAEVGTKKSHKGHPPNMLEAGGEGSGMRAGHSLHEAAIENGRLVDPRPFGSPLKAVLTVMLGAGEQRISEQHMTGGFPPVVIWEACSPWLTYLDGCNLFVVCVLFAERIGPFEGFKVLCAL